MSLAGILLQILLVVLGPLFAAAQDDFRVPSLSGPVVDQVGMMTRSDRGDLERTLHDWHERGIAQVQVLVVTSLGGLSIEDAAIRVFDQWRLGDQRDNGVLFLIAANERKMRIEVGRGLEGALPDVSAKRILDDQVRPLFRAGRPSAGILVGTHSILEAVDGEFEGPAARPWPTVPVVIFAFLVFFLLFFFHAGAPGVGMSRRHHMGRGGWGGGGGLGGGGRGGWSGGGGMSAGGGASSGW